MSDDEKLHVDEGWKAQVEREKESRNVSSGESPDEPLSKTKEQQPPPPPPASFQFLVASLATQAMACLGQIPDDDGKPLPVNLPYAKHFIDLLGVIEDKTHNNLNEGEAAYLQGALHQLRIQFVESSRG
jgi:hypothetical protein